MLVLFICQALAVCNVIYYVYIHMASLGHTQTELFCHLLATCLYSYVCCTYSVLVQFCLDMFLARLCAQFIMPLVCFRHGIRCHGFPPPPTFIRASMQSCTSVVLALFNSCGVFHHLITCVCHWIGQGMCMLLCLYCHFYFLISCFCLTAVLCP